jgi:hypothetical protein
MTKINVFKISKGYSKFIIISGSVLAAIGVFIIARGIIKGFDYNFPKGDWYPVWPVLQGTLLIIIGAGNLLRRKYYIEWDENEVKFFLPGTKKAEIIKIADIVSADIRLYEIKLNLLDGIKNIDLNDLQFEDIKRIKEKFGSINRITQ